MMTSFVPAKGAFGEFGGMFVPEILVPALEQLESAFETARRDRAFLAELNQLLRDYAGRETPLYRCRNLLATVRAVTPSEDLLRRSA
jgi:tryptophan synthase beta chain